MSYIDNLAQRIQSRVPNDALPEGDLAALFRLYALLALSKGEEVTARDVHDAWAVWMTGEEPDHPSIQPFDQLTPEKQEEDDVFVEAIRSAAAER